MSNENRLRLILFFVITALHIVTVLFFAVNVTTSRSKLPESSSKTKESDAARIMKLTDLSMYIDEEYYPIPMPMPPLPPGGGSGGGGGGPLPPDDLDDTLRVESIAEIMIETDFEPEQTIVAPGTIVTYGSGEGFGSGQGTGYGSGSGSGYGPGSGTGWGAYLPMHMVSDPPKFDEREIAASLVYPPIALRSGIEGRVILELFVDRNGEVQQIRILQENPKERGFGEAAIKAFTGKKGVPAYADGEPVSSRYRYPVSFRIR